MAFEITSVKATPEVEKRLTENRYPKLKNVMAAMVREKVNHAVVINTLTYTPYILDRKTNGKWIIE